MANPVQNTATQANMTSSTALPITLTNNVIVGNKLAVGISWDTTAVTLTSVDDNLGNNYQLLDNPTTVAGAASAAMALGHVSIGGSCTINAHFSGTFAGLAKITVHEVEGRDPSSPLDGHTMNPESFVGNPRTSGPITTVSPNDYIFGCSFNLNTIDYTAGSGFVLRDEFAGLGSESQIQSSPGSIAATFTMIGDGNSVTGIMALKPTSLVGTYTVVSKIVQSTHPS